MVDVNFIDNEREELIQSAMEYTLDALAGVDLPSGPDFEGVFRREVIRAIDWVEQKLKTGLSPRRRTNLPRTPQDAYENRLKYEDFLKNPAYKTYPTWDALTPEQKALYNNDPNLYKDGTLPWSLLTDEQKLIFASMIEYAPNKESDAERIDGKDASYFLTYRAPIIHVYYIALSFVAPPGSTTGTKKIFFRKYLPNEIKIYHREGGIHIFPAIMARIMGTSGDPLFGSQYGVVAPRIPQVIEVDYTYGYNSRTRPPTLLQAVAYRAGMQIILAISSLYTAGLQSFGVEGFNASFNDGILYKPLYEKFKNELPELLRPFYRPIMTAW